MVGCGSNSTTGTRSDRRQVELPMWRAAVCHAATAPHLVDAVLERCRPAGRIDTTIDAGLQRLVERQIERYLTQYGDQGIRNAAALLVDPRDMGVKAWVGSADYWNDAIDGQVNGVMAKRSPGSTLKPFAYALALDQGVLHPQTIVRDAPTAFGPFTPENIDGRFIGPISAEEALIAAAISRCLGSDAQTTEPLPVPAERRGARAGSRNHSMGSRWRWAVAKSRWRSSPRSTRCSRTTVCCGRCVSSSRAAVKRACACQPRGELYHARHAAPQSPSRRGRDVPVRARWPVAWKTDTSWASGRLVGRRGGGRTGGVDRRFRGAGNPAFIGVDAAAPLFFRITDALNMVRRRGAAVDAATWRQ